MAYYDYLVIPLKQLIEEIIPNLAIAQYRIDETLDKARENPDPGVNKYHSGSYEQKEDLEEMRFMRKELLKVLDELEREEMELDEIEELMAQLAPMKKLLLGTNRSKLNQYKIGVVPHKGYWAPIGHNYE